MDGNTPQSVIKDGITCFEVVPTRYVPDLAEDVRAGLISEPRSLPPKYFYDAYGSKLFERICNTPEYYATRTEDVLLSKHSGEIIQCTRPRQILEFGSGNSQKTRRLFDACQRLGRHCDYAPFEYCLETLEQAAAQLCREYDWLSVHPLLGDYHAGLDNLPVCNDPRLFVFLGSTIGNFSYDTAIGFLQEVQSHMNADDFLLIGADRVKASEVLNAAYNDQQGLTAKFNLNVLDVINRELDADFALDGFRHNAGFNDALARIEMRLTATRNQDVNIAGLNEIVHFNSEDSILTEISQKYSYDGIEKLLISADLKVQRHFESDNHYFSLLLASAAQ